MKKIWTLIIAVALPELVGIVSTPFIIAAIPNWYKALNKPFFSPPNWIFAPVWTLLYLMMGVASYLVWQQGIKKQKVRRALTFYTIQLFLNFVWSWLFFGLHSPILALIDIVFLWVFIVLTMLKFYKISKPAAYLLFPYLLWVSFASLLNLAIVILS
ncbi:TspO protein [Candidatus Roizmanbacteria bacterium RIFCSPHIGHO2_01_FULL_39_8]|uniref:TspO protein n=3 Tax=Candidatus Roizmaniibacteriota TaxID=1752723 RepID=A0A1F7GH72_9BACT|nr:MAG: TspO protein [Candidatus Roizmanbacteria bacterium RIFCSPHIGHO2_01_FULL_39_8]OGK27570.1 MAG: TspO protein [Candidatus Roizmanbacteria bacterium RIFCSPHIGHO2_02_FULL_39_9]OGK36649.1 MAG: TspO protein [Candidatus Roizmanbacteria bacterium RIFCSPHIGHO2_12_FULL_39_8]